MKSTGVADEMLVGTAGRLRSSGHAPKSDRPTLAWIARVISEQHPWIRTSRWSSLSCTCRSLLLRWLPGDADFWAAVHIHRWTSSLNLDRPESFLSAPFANQLRQLKQNKLSEFKVLLDKTLGKEPPNKQSRRISNCILESDFVLDKLPHFSNLLPTTSQNLPLPR